LECSQELKSPERTPVSAITKRKTDPTRKRFDKLESISKDTVQGPTHSAICFESSKVPRAKSETLSLAIKSTWTSNITTWTLSDSMEIIYSRSSRPRVGQSTNDSIFDLHQCNQSLRFRGLRCCRYLPRKKQYIGKVQSSCTMSTSGDGQRELCQVKTAGT